DSRRSWLRSASPCRRRIRGPSPQVPRRAARIADSPRRLRQGRTSPQQNGRPGASFQRYALDWARLMPKRGLAGAAERREIIAGMIRGARERTCGDEKEAFGEPPLPKVRQFNRRDVALDRRMIRCRAKILANGEEVYIGRGKVVLHLIDFGFALAEAQHDTGLGEEPRIERLGAGEQRQ